MKYDQKIKKSIKESMTSETIRILMKLLNDESLNINEFEVTENMEKIIDEIANERFGTCYASKLGYSSAVYQFIISQLLEKLQSINKTINK